MRSVLQQATTWLWTHLQCSPAPEDGQGLVEYGLLMMLTVIVAIAAITLLGATIYDVFWQSSLVDLGL